MMLDCNTIRLILIFHLKYMTFYPILFFLDPISKAFSFCFSAGFINGMKNGLNEENIWRRSFWLNTRRIMIRDLKISISWEIFSCWIPHHCFPSIIHSVKVRISLLKYVTTIKNGWNISLFWNIMNWIYFWVSNYQ